MLKFGKAVCLLAMFMFCLSVPMASAQDVLVKLAGLKSATEKEVALEGKIELKNPADEESSPVAEEIAPETNETQGTVKEVLKAAFAEEVQAVEVDPDVTGTSSEGEVETDRYEFKIDHVWDMYYKGLGNDPVGQFTQWTIIDTETGKTAKAMETNNYWTLLEDSGTGGGEPQGAQGEYHNFLFANGATGHYTVFPMEGSGTLTAIVPELEFPFTLKAGQRKDPGGTTGPQKGNSAGSIFR